MTPEFCFSAEPRPVRPAIFTPIGLSTATALNRLADDDRSFPFKRNKVLAIFSRPKRKFPVDTTYKMQASGDTHIPRDAAEPP